MAYGESDSARVIVSNPGRVDLNLAITVVDGDSSGFTVRPQSLYVYPGESGVFTVGFMPKSAGPQIASVELRYTPTDTIIATLLVTAAGTGVFPVPPGEEEKFRPEDFDRDGKVAFSDFIAFSAAFGSPAEGEKMKFDLNRDGQINFSDFILFGKVFGGV